MGPEKEGSGPGIGVEATELAVEAIPSDASVAVGTFAERLEGSGFQDGPPNIERIHALYSRSPKGRTALYNSVNAATALFGTPQFGDSIYLVTDGGDNRSTVTLEQLENELIRRGIRLFFFLVSRNGSSKTPEERQGPDDARDLSEATGGRLISMARLQGQAKNTAADLASSVRSQVESPLRLNLHLAETLTKSVKLKITAPAHGSTYEIAYPHRLEPCSTPAGK